MKVRDSGMAEASDWDGFFDPEAILSRLGLTAEVGDVVEFGCGYGTFTVPAARVARGTVHALDIEPSMIAATRARAAQGCVSNIALALRDFVADGTGLADETVGYAMLFNILHHEHPVALLREAQRVLRPGGRLGVIHWIHDATTPRGPDLAIRPRPEQCRAWAKEAGFEAGGETIDLPPHHYGLVFRRPGI